MNLKKIYYFLISSFFVLLLVFPPAFAKSQGRTAKLTGIQLAELDRKAGGNHRNRHSKKRKELDKLSYPFPGGIEREKEWKARGVIIKFHHWPNSKQQKEIMERLKNSGLKKKRSIRSFKTWLFEWSEGGLKLSQRGERACKKLKGLSSMKRCNPDHLLPLNHEKSFPKLMQAPFLLVKSA